ncbi:hypothetical protein [Archangium sp.]|nr:hypothetical protein [Archangium sp.]
MSSHGTPGFRRPCGGQSLWQFTSAQLDDWLERIAALEARVA